MACTSGSKNIKQINLSQHKFDELSFNIKNSKLKFDNIEGVFKQIQNDDPGFRRGPGTDDRLLDEEAALRKEIQIKMDKLAKLKVKLAEMDKKHEMMSKILNVDINERDYINEIKSKCGKTPQKVENK
jgi:hypothetical protein